MNKTSKPQSAQAKVPKARVMYRDRAGSIHDEKLHAGDGCPASDPVAVLPFPTARAACAAVKVHNMTHEQRVELVAEAIYANERRHEPQKMTWKTTWGQVREAYRKDARAALSALGFTEAQTECPVCCSRPGKPSKAKQFCSRCGNQP